MAILAPPGCAALPESGRAEIAYQAFNAADFAQTVNIARRPDCYREIGPITSRVVGEHLATGAVVGMWAAVTTAHYYVSHWLDREVDATDAAGWRVTRWIWQGATFWHTGRNIVRNHALGLRPFADSADGRLCGSRS